MGGGQKGEKKKVRSHSVSPRCTHACRTGIDLATSTPPPLPLRIKVGTCCERGCEEGLQTDLCICLFLCFQKKKKKKKQIEVI